MPRESTDRRKSSIGTRRGPPRQYIPFRADDLARGKKTGMAVSYVDRNSDEFEPFDQVIKQADDRAPPRIKSKKKRVSIAPSVTEVDEDGEMSMDLAESNQGSPLAYFTNTNPAYALDGSTRPVFSRSLRGPKVDYDQVPSPRSHLPMRPATTNGRGPSTLSKSFTARDPTPDPDFDYADPATFDDFEPPPLNDSPPRSRTPEVSPEEAGEEDEDAGVEQAIVSQPKRADKGKRRADPMEDEDPGPHDTNGLEDDIVRGLEEIENAQDEEENVPPAKKLRKEATKPKKLRAERRTVQVVVGRSPTPEGVRRGRRHRYPPLEWWRQERVVYGRRDSGVILVPQIKEVIRIPKESPKPLGKAGKRKRGTGSRAKSKGRDTPLNPEEGWDTDTPTNAIVIDYVTQEEVSRRKNRIKVERIRMANWEVDAGVAFMASMIEPKPAANSNWFFQKIFGEGEFIAAGQIHIPPKCQKPSKSTKDNTYVFYVIQGAVSVFIHETSFIITTGGTFLVPRGNTYYIENIAERDAKLFFTQARKVPAEDVQVPHTAQSAPPPSHRRAISEGTSAGPRMGTHKA